MAPDNKMGQDCHPRAGVSCSSPDHQLPPLPWGSQKNSNRVASLADGERFYSHNSDCPHRLLHRGYLHRCQSQHSELMAWTARWNV